MNLLDLLYMGSEKVKTFLVGSLITTGLSHSQTTIDHESILMKGLRDEAFRFGKYRIFSVFSFHSYKFISPLRDRNWHLPQMIGGLSVGQRA